MKYSLFIDQDFNNVRNNYTFSSQKLIYLKNQ